MGINFHCQKGNNQMCIRDSNADWLLGLNYIDFIRDIGAHFSVNRMLAAECFKTNSKASFTS